MEMFVVKHVLMKDILMRGAHVSTASTILDEMVGKIVGVIVLYKQIMSSLLM